MSLLSTAALSPIVTVSPRGIANSLSTVFNDGAQFGPDTSSTQTYGIAEAVTFAGSSGVRTVRLLAGTFKVSFSSATATAITIPSGTNLELDGATVQVQSGSSTITDLFSLGSGSFVLGHGTIDGGSSSVTSVLIGITSATASGVDGNITLQNAEWAVQVVTGKSIIIRGIQPVYCIVQVDSSVDVTLGEIYSLMSSASALTTSPVYVNSSTTPTSQNIVIQNVTVDGDSVYQGTLFTIQNAVGVVLANCVAINTATGQGDGMDITQCSQVGITGALVSGVNYGIKILGSGTSNQSSASVVGCSISNCQGAGILVGDVAASYSSPTTYVTIDGCVISSAGQASGGNAALKAGILVSAYGSTTVSDVVIRGCISYGVTGATQPYGISIVTLGSASATITNVSVIGNDVNGNSTAGIGVTMYAASTLTPIYLLANPGYNPQPATQPTLSGTAYTSPVVNYPQDAIITLGAATLTGVTFQHSAVRGGSSQSLGTAVPLTVHLEPGDTVNVGWSSSVHLPVVTLIPY